MPMGSSGQNEMGNKTNVKPSNEAGVKANFMDQGGTFIEEPKTKEAGEQMERDRPCYSTQNRVQNDKGKFLAVEPEKDKASSRGRINIRSNAEIDKELLERYVAKTDLDRDNYRDECMAKEVPVQDED